MPAEVPRWFMILVVVACVVGLLLWARGAAHHHGQYVGAHPTVAAGLKV